MVNEFPCLKSRTVVYGLEAWKASLKFKMGNVRGKLRQASCLEALANAGKKSKFKPQLSSPHQNIKKTRRGEANYLPKSVAGMEDSSIEDIQVKLQDCMAAAAKDTTLINKLMVSTFAKRRQSITERPVMMHEMMKLWPALFLFNQVCLQQ